MRRAVNLHRSVLSRSFDRTHLIRKFSTPTTASDVPTESIKTSEAISDHASPDTVTSNDISQSVDDGVPSENRNEENHISRDMSAVAESSESALKRTPFDGSDKSSSSASDAWREKSAIRDMIAKLAERTAQNKLNEETRTSSKDDSENPTVNVNNDFSISSVITHSPYVASPRHQKGTHNKHWRSQGSTPHEAIAFDTVLSEMYRDLGPSHGGRHRRPSASSLQPPRDFSFDSGGLSGFGTTATGHGDVPWNHRSVIAGRNRGGLHRPFDKQESPEEEAIDGELDLLKEEMSVYSTDIGLMDWAQRTVLRPLQQNDQKDTDSSPEAIVFHRTYPKILAHLMKILRVNLNNPNLALALFRQAQTHSLESYLSGCQTGAYNELLKTRWESFRDLVGVEQGVQEMKRHGVNWDKYTRIIVSDVVESVMDSGSMDSGRWGEEVMQRVAGLDELVRKDVYHQEIRHEKVAGIKRAWRQNASRNIGAGGYRERRPEMGY